MIRTVEKTAAWWEVIGGDPAGRKDMSDVFREQRRGATWSRSPRVEGPIGLREKGLGLAYTCKDSCWA